MKDLLNSKFLIITGVMLLIMGIEGIFLWKSVNKKECICETVESSILATNLEVETNDSQSVEVSYVYVDVKGAVKNPGVYKLEETAIVNDAIKAAGGFTSNAYKNNINLSKKITNEMVIYVSTKSEYKTNSTSFTCPAVELKTVIIDYTDSNRTYTEVKEENKVEEVSIVNNSVDDTSSEESKKAIIYEEVVEEKNYNVANDKTIASSENDAQINYSQDNVVGLDNKEDGSSSQVSTPNNGLININTASVEDLMTLSGIGESKAKAIVNYRTENGNFKTIEDITNVSGIGQSIYEKIKNNITV